MRPSFLKSKMFTVKKLILALLVIIAHCCAASKSDSLFEPNHLSFSLTNGLCQEFFDGPDHKPTMEPKSTFNYVVKYKPAYALHVQFRYTIGIYRGLSIESGVGYLMQTVLYSVYDYGPNVNLTSKIEDFVGVRGFITLPLYAKYRTPMGKGALSFKLGPDFSLPVHTHFNITDYEVGPPRDVSVSHRFTTSETGQYATMGICAGMTYEKPLRHSQSISIGPVFDLFNVAQFHRHDIFGNSSGYRSYDYYLGLDVVFNIGFHIVTLRKK
jgi:hypothetical protein